MAKRNLFSYKEDEPYENVIGALEKSKVPILTLDKKWHGIFGDDKPQKILKLEKELNDTMKVQGRINSDREELKRLKKTLMKEIVHNMDADENSRAAKKIIKSKDLIGDINDKLILIEDKEISLPLKINKANVSLAVEGLKYLSSKTNENEADIEKLTRSINEMRVEIKKKILLLDKKTDENQKITSYLESTFGREIVKWFEKNNTDMDE